MSIDPESAGAVVTAALAASELEPGGGKAVQHAAAGSVCANCAAVLAGAYCHRCGQNAHVHRSLWHMIEEALHGVLHFETKSWRTLPLLIARPGLLTRRYIDGQRVRYVSPLALFLFSVFLMFFLISHIDAPLANVTVSAVPVSELAEAKIERRPAQAATELAGPAGDAAQAPANAARRQRLNINFKLPRWAGKNADNTRVDRAVSNPELTLYKMKNTAYKFSFMLIPISLPFLWLLFCRRRDVTVYDHMVFCLYSLSFMSLWAVLVAALRVYESTNLWLWSVLLIPPVHMYLQLRETYALRWFAALWRAALLLGVAGTGFLVFLILVVSLSI